VVFLGALPGDVPGLFDLAARQRQLRAEVAALGPGERLPGWPGVRRWPQGAGRFLRVDDLPSAIASTGIRREPLAERGLGVLRQRVPDGHLYFLTNLGAAAVEGWLPLGTPAASAVVLDALSGERGRAELRPPAGTARGPDILLRLAPGQSLLLRTLAGSRSPGGAAWRGRWPTPATVPMPGPWQVSFLRGGPTVPAPVRLDRPLPWSAHADPGLREFSGTAVYRTEVTLARAPAPDEAFMLELGAVQAMAVVRVNGAAAGVIWALPYQLDVTRRLRAGRNLVELEVTSVPANRIAALARSGAPRVRYHDIDFVDIQYRPFDPTSWAPVPSGISGPVQLRVHRRR
jgi:hypothetical protein